MMWREGERGFDFELKLQVGRVRLSRFHRAQIAGGTGQAVPVSRFHWADVYRNVPNALSYLPNVFDPILSSAAAAAYLNLRLIWNIGLERYNSGNYTEDDLKSAIRDYNGSSIAKTYANQIWDCAQKLKAGDLNGALKAIGKP